MIFACRDEGLALKPLSGDFLLYPLWQGAEHLVIQRLAEPEVVDVVCGVDQLVVLRELFVVQVDVEVAGHLLDLQQARDHAAFGTGTSMLVCPLLLVVFMVLTKTK